MGGFTRKDSSKHRAAVITPDTVFYGRGTAAPCDRKLGSNLTDILNGSMVNMVEHCTIIVDGVPLEAHAATAPPAGWKRGEIQPWTVYYTGDGRTVSVGVRDAMHGRHFGILFDRDTDPGVLAMLLDRYYGTTGNPWRGTGSMSALNAIRLTWGNPGYRPLWRLPKECVKNSSGPLVWRRDLNENEQWWGYVHVFDGNSAYLGAAISADLAWSRLHHIGIQRFDPGLPGYWLLDLPNEILAASDGVKGPPLVGRRANTTSAWVTTPYAKFLYEHAVCDVLDSWTARAELREGTGKRLHAAGSRILRAWGEHSRDGLVEVHPSVAKAAKRTYSEAIGGMQSDTAIIYRPDWGHTVIDLWRATLLRRVLRVRKEIGYWPIRIHTDSVAYADSNPDPRPLAQHVGAQLARPYRLGQLHHERTYTTAEWLAKFPPLRKKMTA